MNRVEALSVFCLLTLALGVISLNILPAFGVPGNGTSITVVNEDTGGAPDVVWSYTITELYAPKNKNPFTISFTLSAGETDAFGGLRNGWYRVVETSKFGYSATMTITSNKYSDVEVVAGFEIDVNIESSEGKTVAFTNNPMPSFAMSGEVDPPGDIGYSIPPLTPIPVQASWEVDINNDGRLDLVLDKPTAILVNLTGSDFPVPPTSEVTVSVAFEGAVYSATVLGSYLESNSVISFYPITPSSAGNETITGIYQVDGGDEIALFPTDVTVKDTISLSLYYAGLTKSSYGDPEDSFSEMAENSRDFIEATYPVKSVTADVSYKTIAGSRPGSKRDPYAGMLKDAQAVAQQAQLAMGGSAVGIAIAPNVTGLEDYFTYHGFPGAAGVSFGPAVKGVIALEGYYAVPAHEVAHTFGLYYGVPEEYSLPGAPFTASGVSASNGAWKTGYSFMSLAQYGTTDLTWVNTATTYEYLFSKTVLIPNDPDILLVSGVIYDDGTVEFPLDWIHMVGYEDTIEPGDYLLRYIDADGNTLREISFNATFSLQTSVPDENGFLIPGEEISIDEAGFSFAAPYPPDGTTRIQVVNGITGEILGGYDMADVKSFGISSSIEGSVGLEGWYTSDVDVTLTSIVNPDAPVPPAAIHYILDSGSDTVYSEPFSIQGVGEHSLHYWGVDDLGGESMQHNQTVKIDSTPPITTDNYDGAWHNSITITLAGTDAASGMNETYYKINDGATKSVSVDSQPLIMTEGATNKLEYWSVDVAGNVESSKILSDIKIDATVPIISGAPDREPNENGWYNDDVFVSFTAVDALSGIASVTAPVTLGEGEDQSVTGIAIDLAGNTASTTVGGIKIDKTPPIITFINPTEYAVYAVGAEVFADWTAFDSLSGLDYAIGTVESGQLIDTSQPGVYTITVTAYDLAGNSAVLTLHYSVGYVFTGFISPIDNSEYNVGRTVPVKFELRDQWGNLASYANIYIYTIQNGEEKPGTEKGSGASGNLCQYDPLTNRYQFNLDTKKLVTGMLTIKVTLDDGTSHEENINLT